MSLRFILGRSASGKTKTVFDDITEKLYTEPDGPPLILLVPDQMTFHTEYRLASTPGLEGMTRLNVYSFSRMAMRIMEETGGLTRQHLSDPGLEMLLRKIIESYSGDLHIFRQLSDKSGFYSVLNQTISEFKKYCIDPDNLDELAARLSGSGSGQGMLADKMHDLKLIYDAFEEEIKGKYIASEDYLRLATEQMDTSTDIPETEVWVDGFDKFTPQERLFLQDLARYSKNVTVTLTADERLVQSSGEQVSVFFKPLKTWRKLKAEAEEAGVAVEAPVWLYGDHRHKVPALEYLEWHYEDRPVEGTREDAGIRLTEAVNRREEVEEAARQIKNMVREEDVRYREIAVLVRDLDLYHHLFATVFSDFDIPFFIDKKRPMRHHPVIELVRSTLDTINRNWRYEAVFRCIKTDLLFSIDQKREERAAADLLENDTIASGVKGKKLWTQAEPWTVHRPGRTSYTEETAIRLDRLRKTLADPIAELENELKSASTVREFASVLYFYLEGLAIPDKLQILQEEALDDDRLDEAREHDQVWGAVITLLDELVEIAGEETMSLQVFSRIIDTGLDALEFALVPPSVDQTVIGSIDRTRAANVKAVFILGANEGVLPAKPGEGGMLSDEDRERLLTLGVELGESQTEQIFEEDYFIYKALSSSLNSLTVSYPLASEDGDGLRPSSLIDRLRQWFPDIKTQLVTGKAYESDAGRQLDYLNSTWRALGSTAATLKRWEAGYPVSDIWWESYNWFAESDEWRGMADHIFSSLTTKNNAAQLEKEVARQLYGSRIKASVSRMEQFYSCAFAQYANYGLKLKPREIHRLEAPDIGQLFHDVLKEMTQSVISHHKEWSELTRDECRAYADQAVEKLAPGLQNEILLSSARYKYLKNKLREVVLRASDILQEHAARSGFSPLAVELPFGPGAPLPPLELQLPDGTAIEIIGRIDRVDGAEGDNGVLLRIIDYKSSTTDLDLAEFYYGLSLQMLIYLDIVMAHAKDWLGKQGNPAGVLYFHVHNPFLAATKHLKREEIDKALLKAFKMKGLLLEDETVIRMMDQSLTTSHSDMLPVAIKKNGDFYSSSSVAAPEVFRRLQRHAREKMVQAGAAIIEGDVKIDPYKMKGKTPCQFCSFKAVCQFDPGRPENHYRHFKPLKDKDVIETLQREEKKHED